MDYRLLLQPSDPGLHPHEHHHSQSSILWSQDPNHCRDVRHLFGSESASTTDQSDRDLGGGARDQESCIEDSCLGGVQQAGRLVGNAGEAAAMNHEQSSSSSSSSSSSRGREEANQEIDEEEEATKAARGLCRERSASRAGAATVTGGRLSLSSKWDDADRWIMRQMPSTPSSASSSSSSAGGGGGGGGGHGAAVAAAAAAHHYSPQKPPAMAAAAAATANTTAAPVAGGGDGSAGGGALPFPAFPKAGGDADLALHAATKLWLGGAAAAADKDPQIAWDAHAARLSCAGAGSPQPHHQPHHHHHHHHHHHQQQQLLHRVAPARRSMKEVGTDTDLPMTAAAAAVTTTSMMFGGGGAAAGGVGSPPRHNTPTRRRSTAAASSARSSTAAAGDDGGGPPRVELRDCHLAKLKLARERASPLSCPLSDDEELGSSRITITHDRWPAGGGGGEPSSPLPHHHHHHHQQQHRRRRRPDILTHFNPHPPHDFPHFHHPAPSITPTHSLLTNNHPIASWPSSHGLSAASPPDLSRHYFRLPPYSLLDHDAADYFCSTHDFVNNKYDYGAARSSSGSGGGGTFDLVEARASAWEDVELAKYTAKFKREEAKIEAWESLQRAEAEAELKKLEVKLEKLRFGSREKILGRLWAAEKRAEEMRAAAKGQRAAVLARVNARANNIRHSQQQQEQQQPPPQQQQQLSGFINVCFTKKKKKKPSSSSSST